MAAEFGLYGGMEVTMKSLNLRQVLSLTRQKTGCTHKSCYGRYISKITFCRAAARSPPAVITYAFNNLTTAFRTERGLPPHKAVCELRQDRKRQIPFIKNHCFFIDPLPDKSNTLSASQSVSGTPAGCVLNVILPALLIQSGYRDNEHDTQHEQFTWFSRILRNQIKQAVAVIACLPFAVSSLTCDLMYSIAREVLPAARIVSDGCCQQS